MPQSNMFSRGVYRPRPVPSSVPFGVRSVGSSHADPGQSSVHKFVNFTELFWSVSGEATIRINGTDWPMPPEHLAFILPGAEHFQYTQESSWVCHWLTLDGAAALAVVLGFGIDTARPQPVGICPMARFQNLEAIVGNPGANAERQASSLAYELLAIAAGQAVRPTNLDPSGLVDEALEILHSQRDDLCLGVAQLADRLGVHRSVLSRHFQEQLGCSPSAYIGNLRLQLAAYLLEHTDLSIATIAHQVGYRDAGYLARLTQREYCLSPTEYRRRSQDRTTDIVGDQAPWRHRSGFR